MHVREQDPDKEEKQAEIADQLAQFRTKNHSEAAVFYISLHHPQDEAGKGHELVQPDPRCFLRDPHSCSSTVKNHRITPGWSVPAFLNRLRSVLYPPVSRPPPEARRPCHA